MDKSLESGESDDLKNQLSERDCRITNPEQELAAEMEKRISELTDKSLSFAEVAEKLNTLFGVFLGTASTSVGKKIGNLFTGKH